VVALDCHLSVESASAYSFSLFLSSLSLVSFLSCDGLVSLVSTLLLYRNSSAVLYFFSNLTRPCVSGLIFLHLFQIMNPMGMGGIAEAPVRYSSQFYYYPFLIILSLDLHTYHRGVLISMSGT